MGAGHPCLGRSGGSCAPAGAGAAEGRCPRRPVAGEPAFLCQRTLCPKALHPCARPRAGSLPPRLLESRPAFGLRSPVPARTRLPWAPGEVKGTHIPRRSALEPEIAPRGRRFPVWAGFHWPEPSEVKILPLLGCRAPCPVGSQRSPACSVPKLSCPRGPSFILFPLELKEPSGFPVRFLMINGQGAEWTPWSHPPKSKRGPLLSPWLAVELQDNCMSFSDGRRGELIPLPCTGPYPGVHRHPHRF